MLTAFAALALGCGNQSVHLSLGTTPGDVIVSWSASRPGGAKLWFAWPGESPDEPASWGAGVNASSTDVLNNTDGGDAWRVTYVHHATIPRDAGWSEGSTFLYSVSAADGSGSRGACIFNTSGSAQQTRGGGRPATLAIFGDLGVKEQDGANWTLARLKQHLRNNDHPYGPHFDAVLHVGDFAYDLKDGGGRTGEEFLTDMQDVASAVPYLTCPGNHERDCPHAVGEGCTDPPYSNYRGWFGSSMPAPRNASARAMYWSADIGYAHVVSINTDGCLLGHSAAQAAALAEQHAWLEADLARAHANRAKVPWVVVIGHEMMYSTHDASHVAQAKLLRDGGDMCTDGFEPLFFDYGVDLYFSGHEHVYERFQRTLRGAAHTNATAYIVVGNAGNREFPYMNGSAVAGFVYDMPAYESFRAASPSGFGLLELRDPTTMVWTQYNALTGLPIDTHTYKRSDGWGGDRGAHQRTGLGEL
jgi:hypothetical protein